MTPHPRYRWLLSIAFSVLVILAAVLFDGSLRVIAVLAVALLYFFVTRRYLVP